MRFFLLFLRKHFYDKTELRPTEKNNNRAKEVEIKTTSHSAILKSHNMIIQSRYHCYIAWVQFIPLSLSVTKAIIMTRQK